MPSSRRPIRLQLPVELWAAVDAAAKAARITPEEMIRRAVSADLGRAVKPAAHPRVRRRPR